MKPIPETNNALVVRIDFTDDAAWDSICEAIVEPHPVEGFQACVDFLSEPEYDAISTEQLISLIPQSSTRTFIFVVDRTTLSQSDRPIQCIDLYDEPGRTFRVIPAEMWAVENNLSIANMDFDEFASAVDPDGVHRGFPES